MLSVGFLPVTSQEFTSCDGWSSYCQVFGILVYLKCLQGKNSGELHTTAVFNIHLILIGISTEVMAIV